MQFNALIPELSVTDLKKSLHFYIEIIGFKVEYLREESEFVFLSLSGNQIMLSQCNGNWETGLMEYPLGRGINFQMFVTQVDPILLSLTKASYPLMKAPWNSSYRKESSYVNQREFLVQDPDGYLLRFAQIL